MMNHARILTLVVSLALPLFLATLTEAKPGNGNGKPGSGGETPTCTGAENKEPEIIYLTGLDTSGEIHTQDMYLSSASGCDRYLLLEHAAARLPDQGAPGDLLVDVTDLRVDIDGMSGIATWRDQTIVPDPLVTLRFDVGATGSVTPDSNGTRVLYTAPDGGRVISADVRFNVNREVELVLIERAPDEDKWRLAYVNVDAGLYTVLAAGNCPVQDQAGSCYIPSYWEAWWNEDGSEVYAGVTRWPDLNGTGVIRVRRSGGTWQPIEMLMTHAEQIIILGIRQDGMLAYEAPIIETTTRGNKTKTTERWMAALVNPDMCSVLECSVEDGDELGVDAQSNLIRYWTRGGSLLFTEWAPSGVRILREYANPDTGEVGRLELSNVDAGEWGTTY